MKRIINVEVKEPVVHLSTEVVYGHRVAWADVDYRQLKVSILKPRTFFEYDTYDKRPLLVFISGGGFSEMERNAWIPDLVWFARKGYVVASIDYSVTARTVYPMQIEDVKSAIRFLKAHADEFYIDPSKVVVMGESAGGYLAGLTALTNGEKEFDKGENLEFSSNVNAAVCIYPGVDMGGYIHGNAPSLQDIVKPGCPPFMILQGLADSLVKPEKHSDLLYDALVANDVPVDYYLIEGANHADAHFYQDEMKEKVLDFMNSI